MRKLGKANIISFIIFSIIVVFIIVVFVYGIQRVLLNGNEEYTVEKGSVTFDEDYNNIVLEDSGIIKRNWNGKYYLSYENNKKQHCLGPNTIVYNSNDYRMYSYGTLYEVFEDGSVSKEINQTEIVRNTGGYFYKISDRKYLLIDKEIVDEKKNIYAKNFLMIILDKSGNALLINDELNVKTINSVVLKSSNFIFDIANEKLTFNGNEIDLKKVIGSTNLYQKPKKTTDNNDDNNTGGNTGIDTGGNGTTKELPQFQKRVTIESIVPSITYADIYYSVIDPANEYVSVFLLLSDGLDTSKTQLSKEQTSYKIRNLNPNYEYTISIGYSYLNTDTDLVEEIQDVVTLRTSRPDYKLSITKVSSSRVYFNFKTDSKYNLESGKLVLYSDNVLVDYVEIDTNAAVSTNGWTSSIELLNPGYEIVLKLENAIYNGNSVNFDLQSKYINY